MPHKICSVIPAKAGIHFAYPLPQARILNVPTREINFQRDLKNHLPIIGSSRKSVGELGAF